jgi:CheY-like chemotaxis protein
MKEIRSLRCAEVTEISTQNGANAALDACHLPGKHSAIQRLSMGPFSWWASKPDGTDEQPSEAPVAASSAAGHETKNRLSGCRILVVDDNHDGADSLAMMLEVMGATTSVAYDGEDALTRVDAFDPHVMLLDLSLPGLKGDEVARIVRDRRGEDVLLVAVTGWSRDEDRDRSLRSGFDYHVVKPVEVHALQMLLASDPRAGRDAKR